MARLRKDFPEITDDQAAKTDHYNLYVNSDKGRIYGLQVNGNLSPVRGVDVSVNYAWIYGRQLSNGVWQNLERSIRNTFTMMANFHHVWQKYTLDVNLNGRLQSKTYYQSGYENAPGYGIWNLNTVHTVYRFRKLWIQPSIGIENIFNTKDRRIGSSIRRYANFSPGRLIVIGMRLKFG